MSLLKYYIVMLVLRLIILVSCLDWQIFIQKSVIQFTFFSCN